MTIKQIDLRFLKQEHQEQLNTFLARATSGRIALLGYSSLPQNPDSTEMQPAKQEPHIKEKPPIY